LLAKLHPESKREAGPCPEIPYRQKINSLTLAANQFVS